MTDELTTTDAELDATWQTNLESLESVVGQWMVSFGPAGLALRTICEDKLYRATHKTFEEYCRERWNYSRRHAYQLIQSAETWDYIRMCSIEHILPPERESHARVLSRLHDMAQRLEAWCDALLKAGGNPRMVEAKDVAEAVSKFLPEKVDPPFDFVRERDEMFGWLIGRLEKWPDEYRDTFAAFVTNIANDIQEQQRAD